MKIPVLCMVSIIDLKFRYRHFQPKPPKFYLTTMSTPIANGLNGLFLFALIMQTLELNLVLLLLRREFNSHINILYHFYDLLLFLYQNGLIVSVFLL